MSQRNEEHIKGGGKIRSAILGMNDGLISTFTLLVGIAAATLTGGNTLVILTGIAAMVSGAISMGLGEYISSKSEWNYVKNEIKKEEAEIQLFPEEEKQEVKDLFIEMGLEGDTLNACVEKITRNKDIWLNFLIKNELGLEESENPLIGAIITFLAFILGSLIPQLPYFLNLGMVSLVISSILSLGSLFVVGALKTKITGESRIKSGFEMVLIGIIAFIASYGIGILFEQLF
ncbi:MAG: VIT1/CCC1 transporter family protein [Candidatus Lokiarchaeota archaeon]|nr:VIT1/CCC1 transporter family protein [Candidatus Lokiarchaeota archaeon]